AIEADAGQVRLAVVTIVTNAIEAIGEGKGVLAVKTSTGRFTQETFRDAVPAAQTPDGEYVCLEIEDSGAGMSEETRRRLTEPSFTPKVFGRGLGLAAVHGIVRAHRGALTVTSQVGHGATVRVFLPVSRGGATTAAHEASAPAEEGQTRRRIVLVVDDE